MQPTIKVTGDAAVIEQLGKLTPQLSKDLTVTVTRLAIEMVAYVKGSKLSGQVLKNRTGTLRRSITQKVISDDTGVRATVGTNLSYAGVHEYGFNGTQAVKAHLRKSRVGGEPAQVRAHSRRVNMPERSYLRSSLSENAENIRAKIRATATESVRGKG